MDVQRAIGSERDVVDVVIVIIAAISVVVIGTGAGQRGGGGAGATRLLASTRRTSVIDASADVGPSVASKNMRARRSHERRRARVVEPRDRSADGTTRSTAASAARRW